MMIGTYSQSYFRGLIDGVCISFGVVLQAFSGLTGAGMSRGAITVLMLEERPPANCTLNSWAISVLRKAGAIRECEEHGWTQDSADPHPLQRNRSARSAARSVGGRSCR
ncbi:hypothetical protein ABIB80_007944 [Bradyrhizobium sp. i1.15.2]